MFLGLLLRRVLSALQAGRPLVAAGLALVMAACATPPAADDEAARAAYKEANDPLEPLNRTIFEINRGLDKLIFRPVAELYRNALPDGLRDGVRNAVNNLDTPNILVNDLLQGEWRRSSESARRFTVNSLAGAGGLVDLMAMEPGEDGEPVPFHNEDFGQTLAVWGAGEGPYLVLPIFGPSNVRDAFGRVGDLFLDPLNHVIPSDVRTEFGLSRMLANGIDSRSRVIESLDDIERDSIDLYAAIRSLYRQYRRNEIVNGEIQTIPAPDISINFDDDLSRERRAAVLQ